MTTRQMKFGSLWLGNRAGGVGCLFLRFVGGGLDLVFQDLAAVGVDVHFVQTVLSLNVERVDVLALLVFKLRTFEPSGNRLPRDCLGLRHRELRMGMRFGRRGRQQRRGENNRNETEEFPGFHWWLDAGAPHKFCRWECYRLTSRFACSRPPTTEAAKASAPIFCQSRVPHTSSLLVWVLDAERRRLTSCTE
jgi:hypothetical protein